MVEGELVQGSIWYPSIDTSSLPRWSRRTVVMKDFNLKHREPEQQMELVRGLEMLGHGWAPGNHKMFSFLTIFHPEMSLEDRLQLTHEVTIREEERRR